MENKMKPQIKKQWVEALRSGKYKQGRLSLRTSENEYCCLGVLCDLHAQATGGSWELASPNYSYQGSPNYAYQGAQCTPDDVVLEWAGLSSASFELHRKLANKYEEQGSFFDTINCLMDCNDCLGLSFNQIADLIEETL